MNKPIKTMTVGKNTMTRLALMGSDKEYWKAEILSRYTKQEMIDALVEYEQGWLQNANISEIEDVYMDILLNGYESKGWHHMTIEDLAEEAIDAIIYKEEELLNE